LSQKAFDVIVSNCVINLSIDKPAVFRGASPFHLDEEAARDTIFQDLVASGWHTAALTMRLLVKSEITPAGRIVGADLTSSVGHGPCGPAMSSISKVKCSRWSVEVAFKPGSDKGPDNELNQNNEAAQVQIANLIVPRRQSG
jgi:hypothetical protein